MNTVDLDTWVSIGSLIGVGLVLGGMIIGTTRGLRSELKADIADLRTVVDRLDDRVYALATKQAPAALIVPRKRG